VPRPCAPPNDGQKEGGRGRHTWRDIRSMKPRIRNIHLLITYALDSCAKLLAVLHTSSAQGRSVPHICRVLIERGAYTRQQVNATKNWERPPSDYTCIGLVCETPGCVTHIKCTGSIRRPHLCRVFIERTCIHGMHRTTDHPIAKQPSQQNLHASASHQNTQVSYGRNLCVVSC